MSYKYTLITRTAKFWSRVDQSGGDNACWIWLASHNNTGGYGEMFWRGHVRRAHRISYELAHGEFPDELDVLHSCDNPICVNPKHLRLGNDFDNAADRTARGRSAALRNEANPHAKLSNDQVRDIRRLYAQGTITYKALGMQFGVCDTHIRRIVNGVNRILTD